MIMNAVPSIAESLHTRVRQAFAAVLPHELAEADPMVRRSDYADFQVNGILPLARQIRANPREIAAKIAAACEVDEVFTSFEVSGPGFLNVRVADGAIIKQVRVRLDSPSLGATPASRPRKTVIDYSQPNIAKEMHVGHLRSTILGDALARILVFSGAEVARQNHLGDWGTQFGMLIQYIDEHPDIAWRRDEGEPAASARPVSELNELYRTARTVFDADEDFAERARRRVVALQAGDGPTVAAWRKIVAESKLYFNDVYDRLGVLLTDEDAVGESFYNPFLAETAAQLEADGVAVHSDGALCVFFDDIVGPEGRPTPLIVRKSDGGFGYAATDLAAIKYRAHTLGAGRILYVVDARQALHFRMVFETARRAGWLDGTEAVHVPFGTVLRSDGKPFKTRSGDAARLVDLLAEAVMHARETIIAKSGDLHGDQLDRTAAQVGIGAVKYADLATSRTKDYVFDVNRMVSLTGNTGVYLQYAHARIRSLLRKLPAEATRAQTAAPISLAPPERELCLLLDDFSATVDSVVETLEPHRLCGYLYSLAQAFTQFYETCPVLKAPSVEIRDTRAVMCLLTGETMRIGLGLLGIEAPDQL